ncbi:hypothetical protein MJM43_30225, partial [Salmonella enterica subsp. enterica serovar Montevideo]|nr:hypothetical protein [Salmonella enterica subsp. enterica serovar Montevideo]
GEAKQKDLIFYAVLPAMFRGSLADPQLTFAPGALLRSRGRVIDASSIFSSQRKNHDVDIVFIQSKRSESFDLGDFLKFKASVFR